MNEQQAQDEYLEDALRKQRELMDFYKEAAKHAPEKRCKALFKHLESGLEAQVGDVASELSRHRMEHGLGHPLDHK